MGLLKIFVKNLKQEISRSKYSQSSETYFDRIMKSIRKDLQEVENLTTDDLSRIIKKLDNPNNFKRNLFINRKYI